MTMHTRKDVAVLKMLFLATEIFCEDTIFKIDSKQCSQMCESGIIV
jgi:hypothetical protein